MGKSRYATVYDLESVQGRLYYARAARGVSRQVVAKAFGCRPDTLKNWERCENHTTTVPLVYVQYAARAFDVPESWILGETHEAPLPPPHPPTETERIFWHITDSPATVFRRRLKEAGIVGRPGLKLRAQQKKPGPSP